MDSKSATVPAPIAAPGAGDNRKHPSLAVNSRGELLLAWTEGTGWQKGGSLAWQLFDSEGQPKGERGKIEAGIPTWSMPAAVARRDGTFLLIH